jgi:hypothetical protein
LANEAELLRVMADHISWNEPAARGWFVEVLKHPSQIGADEGRWRLD